MDKTEIERAFRAMIDPDADQRTQKKNADELGKALAPVLVGLVINWWLAPAALARLTEALHHAGYRVRRLDVGTAGRIYRPAAFLLAVLAMRAAKGARVRMGEKEEK